MSHNAEPAACDLLMEVEKLEQILNHVDRTNAQVHKLHYLFDSTMITFMCLFLLKALISFSHASYFSNRVCAFRILLH